MTKNFVNELFGSEKDEWGTPKLKSLEKDKPIASSLESLINVACTSPCAIEDIVSKYKIPENCNQAAPPMVNNEVWKILDRQIHSQDKCLTDVQNIITTAMVPVIKLTTALKSITSLSSDTLTLNGQAQYNLSVPCRYRRNGTQVYATFQCQSQQNCLAMMFPKKSNLVI